MAKKFVLDTNVLINDPKCVYKFANSNIVIPLLVLEEIDGLKKREDAVGQSARQVARELDQLRAIGNLHHGIKIPNSKGRLTVVTEISPPKFIYGKQVNDHLILQCCLDLIAEEKRKKKSIQNVVLITEDINLRILADAMGVPVERYKNISIDDISFYEETPVFTAEDDFINALFEQGEIADYTKIASVLHNNDYAVLRSPSNRSALVRYRKINDVGVFLLVRSEKIYSMFPNNKEQAFALDALTDPEIELVVLAGKAGTGKTLMALAAGLEQVTETHYYEQLTVSRPVVSLGKELGYLPGSLSEKLDPWMGPIYDNIAFLFKGAEKLLKKGGIGKDRADYFKDRGQLQIEALQYIRGRSMPNQFMIIDEAQNLSSHEIKTIITRAGKGTKIVFTGDPYQIDSPYLDEHNNGITYIIDRFKGQDCFASVTLHKGERSNLAELGSKLL